MEKNLDYRADLLADLRNDKEYAGLYLSAAYADSPEAFLVALRDVAEAQKGIATVAAKARVNRESLYRMLSAKGNPTLNTLSAVLKAMGLKIAVQPEQETAVWYVPAAPWPCGAQPLNVPGFLGGATQIQVSDTSICDTSQFWTGNMTAVAAQETPKFKPPMVSLPASQQAVAA